MIKVFWLFMISGVKVILTKGISVALLLLSIFIKGKINHFDEKQWDMYFKNMKEAFILNFGKLIYLTATIVSSFIAYILFRITDFQYPMHLAIILCLVTSFYTWVRYRKVGRQKIMDGFQTIRKNAKTN